MVTYLQRLSPTASYDARLQPSHGAVSVVCRHRARQRPSQPHEQPRAHEGEDDSRYGVTLDRRHQRARGRRLGSLREDPDWVVTNRRPASASGPTSYSNVIGAVIRQ